MKLNPTLKAFLLTLLLAVPVLIAFGAAFAHGSNRHLELPFRAVFGDARFEAMMRGEGGTPHYLGKERSEEHTSELQSRPHLVCRLLLEFSRHHLHLHSFPTRRSSDLHAKSLPSYAPLGRARPHRFWGGVCAWEQSAP